MFCINNDDFKDKDMFLNIDFILIFGRWVKMGKFKDMFAQNEEEKGLNVYEDALNVALKALYEIR